LLRTYGYEPFYLKEHLDRLKQSAATLQIPYPDGIETIVHALIEKNNFEDLLIRIYLSEDEISSKPHLLILTGPVPKHNYENGLSVTTTKLQRQFPLIKSTCYVPALIALKEAAKRGADDALFLSPSDEFLELTKSNFFAVFENKLYTAPDDVLPGITRGIVIKLAQELGIPFKESSLPYSALPYIEEAFSTSTTREVLPISQIDSVKIPLGPIAKLLQEPFKALVFN